MLPVMTRYWLKHFLTSSLYCEKEGRVPEGKKEKGTLFL